MIARIWRGWTRSEDADAYVEYLQATGIPAYRATPGNRGAYILRRAGGDRTEFVTLTFWSSLESVKAFAGEAVDRRSSIRRTTASSSTARTPSPTSRCSSPRA